jgi:hypothetical protein
MLRQARKLCARGDLGINCIRITLHVVELAAYCCFHLAAAWLLLFGDIEENSACPLSADIENWTSAPTPKVSHP